MKKIKLGLFLLVFSVFETAYTYELPPYNFSNQVISIQYSKLQANITKYFQVKIDSFDSSNKTTFDSKVLNIKTLFQNLDEKLKLSKKNEARVVIKNLKKEIVDLVIFLKKYKKVEIISKNETIEKSNLNDYANSSQIGDITYYNDAFEWLGTANGNTFSQKNFSAAKCDIPFNTMIQIWLDNKSIITKVNDRPNCYLYSNLIDMTTTSFDFLYKRYVGKKSVSYVILGTVNKAYTKTFIDNNYFENIGVILDGRIPNSYLKNESIHINWKIEPTDRFVTFSITSPSGKTVDLIKEVKTYFSFSYPLEEVGEYKINFSGNEKSYSIFVMDEKIFTGKKFVNKDFTQIEKPIITKEELWDGIFGYRVVLKNPDYHMIKISQGDKQFFYSGIQDIIIPENIIEKELNIGEKINIAISTTATITGFSHDFYTNPVVVFNGEVGL